MQWVASTLHTTSEHGVSSITTADVHTSAVSSRLNWRPPADLNGLLRFTRKKKSGLCACALTFQPTYNTLTVLKFQEFSGRFKKFTRMPPAHFEPLMNLVGPKILKRGCQISSSYSGSRETGSIIAILCHRRLVHMSEIFFPNLWKKQPRCPRSMSSYCWGMDGKLTGKKLCTVQSKVFCT